MSWRELLEREIEATYRTVEGLMGLVDDDLLDWKPATGKNWMTTGQLLRHLSDGCGAPMKGFATGDWGMPEDLDPSQLSPEDLLPPAEKMPTVGNAAEARKLLAEDLKVARKILAGCSVEDLAHKPAPAPWDPSEMILGHRFLQMVQHLAQHKAQLFYYLKLQGKPVDTGHLWGM